MCILSSFIILLKFYCNKIIQKKKITIYTIIIHCNVVCYIKSNKDILICIGNPIYHT